MMFGSNAQHEEFRAEIRATLGTLLEKTDRLVTSLDAATADLYALKVRVAVLEEADEARERQRLWLRIEKLERQMQVDAAEARTLAQAWIEQRSALPGNTG